MLLSHGLVCQLKKAKVSKSCSQNNASRDLACKTLLKDLAPTVEDMKTVHRLMKAKLILTFSVKTKLKTTLNLDICSCNIKSKTNMKVELKFSSSFPFCFAVLLL